MDLEKIRRRFHTDILPVAAEIAGELKSYLRDLVKISRILLRRIARIRFEPDLFSARRYPFFSFLYEESLGPLSRRKRGVAFLIGLLLFALPIFIFDDRQASGFKSDISGYVKSFNFFSRTSGFTPEMIDHPAASVEPHESIFSNMERLRVKLRETFEVGPDKEIMVKIDYDHQTFFGSAVASGDSRIMEKQSEERQFLDLSQSLVEDDDAFYEHRLYRASLSYRSDGHTIEIGRQQIPWGVCYFFTPTDLFNPFNPLQLELDERDGVDAINAIANSFHGYKVQAVYTPPGKQLHPQRYLMRVSRDIQSYEVGILGGHVKRDNAIGFDAVGNIKGTAIRGEFLYRQSDLQNDFIKFTINADYNFPHNIYGLLEYHFNGQGERNPKFYDRMRLLRGEIQQLGKNYLAALLGYDITPLLRIENRTMFNIDDESFFLRPEVQYEIRKNFLLTGGSQLYLGGGEDEFGQPRNVFFSELKYSF